MSVGKAVVGCRGQGIAEIIQHGSNGFLVGPDNERELTLALGMLLRDKARRSQIGTAARDTARETNTRTTSGEAGEDLSGVGGVRRRLVILTEIISPYRIPLFNALVQYEEVDLHVIFLAETDPTLRDWHVYKNEIRFSYEVLPSWRKRFGRYNWLLNRGVGHALSKSAPDLILCGGYNYVASWQSLIWARVHSPVHSLVGEQCEGSAPRPRACRTTQECVSE
jgi:hypothetical protein